MCFLAREEPNDFDKTLRISDRSWFSFSIDFQWPLSGWPRRETSKTACLGALELQIRTILIVSMTLPFLVSLSLRIVELSVLSMRFILASIEVSKHFSWSEVNAVKNKRLLYLCHVI